MVTFYTTMLFTVKMDYWHSLLLFCMYHVILHTRCHRCHVPDGLDTPPQRGFWHRSDHRRPGVVVRGPELGVRRVRTERGGRGRGVKQTGRSGVRRGHRDIDRVSGVLSYRAVCAIPRYQPLGVSSIVCRYTTTVRTTTITCCCSSLTACSMANI